AADARTAVRGTHEQVLEPRPLTREEGREGREEQRVAGGLAGAFGNQRLGERTLAEQRALELLRRRAQLVAEVLVVGELAKQLEQQRHVGRLGVAYRDRALSVTHGRSPRGRGLHASGRCSSALSRWRASSPARA